MKKKPAAILFTSIIIIILLWILIISSIDKEKKVCFNEDCFKVKIADSENERETGLMFKEDISKNEGMLFIFNKEGNYSFWMKNTLVPLDIIWLDKNKSVVYIKENIPPCETGICENYYPDKEAIYVLELNAGQITEKNISIGNKALFNLR